MRTRDDELIHEIYVQQHPLRCYDEGVLDRLKTRAASGLQSAGKRLAGVDAKTIRNEAEVIKAKNIIAIKLRQLVKDMVKLKLIKADREDAIFNQFGGQLHATINQYLSAQGNTAAEQSTENESDDSKSNTQQSADPTNAPPQQKVDPQIAKLKLTPKQLQVVSKRNAQAESQGKSPITATHLQFVIDVIKQDKDALEKLQKLNPGQKRTVSNWIKALRDADK